MKITLGPVCWLTLLGLIVGRASGSQDMPSWLSWLLIIALGVVTSMLDERTERRINRAGQHRSDVG